MHQVQFEVYGQGILFKGSFEDWDTALAVYNSFKIPKNWTRHPSFPGEVNHMSMKSNLFNEGALTLGVY